MWTRPGMYPPIPATCAPGETEVIEDVYED